MRENADAQAELTDRMGWTQQDTKLTCLKKMKKDVIKTTEDEIPRKSETGNFETKGNKKHSIFFFCPT
jgi:hypothetical protein